MILPVGPCPTDVVRYRDRVVDSEKPEEIECVRCLFSNAENILFPICVVDILVSEARGHPGASPFIRRESNKFVVPMKLFSDGLDPFPFRGENRVSCEPLMISQRRKVVLVNVLRPSVALVHRSHPVRERRMLMDITEKHLIVSSGSKRRPLRGSPGRWRISFVHVSTSGLMKRTMEFNRCIRHTNLAQVDIPEVTAN